MNVGVCLEYDIQRVNHWQKEILLNSVCSVEKIALCYKYVGCLDKATVFNIPSVTRRTKLHIASPIMCRMGLFVRGI